jgi:NADH-quinone oxidoreductase subunit G
MSDETSTGVEITLNGETVLAHPGELLIDAAERMGTEIPRFCHHTRLKPVGMCRMCLVEVDTGRGSALQPSCMVTCTPNMVVDTESETVAKAQDGVLEFLLINHPLDCPVCDKGGECPLQDQTMAYGPGESRFVEEKRRYEKPIPLNENVFMDRERCILCDRCTRFAGDVAGDQLIHFQGRGAQTEVNTFPEEPFSSYFSGNTVQICPVGALTAKPYRFKARPWDLNETESTSMVDSVGSRISIESSRGQVLRLQGVDSDAVNWGWLSDKERFIFEAYEHPERLVTPLMRNGETGNQEPTSWDHALEAAAELLANTDPDRLAVIGGARLTNESQYAWAKLAKGVLGTDHVDAQLCDGLPAHFMLGLPRATIDQACTPGGTVVLMGPDPKEELGALYLRLRHAVVHDGVTLIELTPRATGLTPYAAHSLRVRPGEAAEAIRAMFGEGGVAPSGGITPETAQAAGALLQAADTVTVLLGRASLAEAEGPVMDAALALHDRLPEVRYLSLLRRSNVHGAIDMGLAPGLLPGRTTLVAGRTNLAQAWPGLPKETGRSTQKTLEAAADGQVDVLILLGADLLADVPDGDLARRALEKAGTVIALDLFDTATVAQADLVLPAAGPTEVNGTFTNLEGRVSPVSRQVTPPGTARPDWMIAVDLAERLGTDLGFTSPEEIWQEITEVSPAHTGLTEQLAADPLQGALATGALALYRPEPTEVARHDAYSFRLVVSRSMYDQGVFTAHSRSLSGLAPTTCLAFEPTDFAALGIEAGQSVETTGPRGTMAVTVGIDPRVAKGTVHLGFNQAGATATEFIDSSVPVTDLTVVPK